MDERDARDIGRILGREKPPRCALVIGAGCSVSAGVPTTEEFVQRIHEAYPNDDELLKATEYDRGIEYLRQDVRLVQPSPDGKAAALTREEIREKQILIGIRTSGAMVRDAALGAAAQ